MHKSRTCARLLYAQRRGCISGLSGRRLLLDEHRLVLDEKLAWPAFRVEPSMLATQAEEATCTEVENPASKIFRAGAKFKLSVTCRLGRYVLSCKADTCAAARHPSQ